jgi:hypothetical protein
MRCEIILSYVRFVGVGWTGIVPIALIDWEISSITGLFVVDKLKFKLEVFVGPFDWIGVSPKLSNENPFVDVWSQEKDF